MQNNPLASTMFLNPLRSSQTFGKSCRAVALHLPGSPLQLPEED